MLQVFCHCPAGIYLVSASFLVNGQLKNLSSRVREGSTRFGYNRGLILLTRAETSYAG